ncbi:MAG: hypothetical protein D6732_28790, partial [Methanobacteriota archaeon]
MKGGVMPCEGITALEALAIAIRREMDMQGLYMEMATHTENDILKERFLNLAQEARRNQLLLEKKYQEMFPDVELKLPPSQLPGKMLDVKQLKKMGLKDILQTAIDQIKQAKEFYLDCALEATDLSGKRMFRYLADMKFSHLMMLNSELEMIEKYPSYYEGPTPW